MSETALLAHIQEHPGPAVRSSDHLPEVPAQGAGKALRLGGGPGRRPDLANLRRLGLWRNRFGDAGARALLAAPHAPRFTALDLSENGISKPMRDQLRGRFGPHVRT